MSCSVNTVVQSLPLSTGDYPNVIKRKELQALQYLIQKKYTEVCVCMCPCTVFMCPDLLCVRVCACGHRLIMSLFCDCRK